MNKEDFLIFLTKEPSISSASAVTTRVRHAMNAQAIIGFDLDIVVNDDNATFEALVRLKNSGSKSHAHMQNAVRKYYKFRNGKEFPSIKNYHSQKHINGVCFSSAKRINQVKCYNVEFGDCFLCKNEDYNSVMLVDCGTYPTFNNPGVVSDICQEIKNRREKNVMISHLHEDHYNGIADLFINDPTLKINNLYLPNYISNGSLEILAEIVFADKNNDLAKAAREILMIPGLFLRHFETEAKIHFLSEGGLTKNEVCGIRALLPRRDLVRQKAVLSNSKIDEFCRLYRDILDYHENEAGDVVVSVSPNMDYGQKISEIISEYLENNEGTKLSKDELDKIKSHFNTNLNRLSLAFDEFHVCESHNVLFLGDAEHKDIKYICNKYARNFYKFIKVSHHGTRPYFYQDLPSAKYYAISNGDAKDSWEISARYDCRYGRDTCFICSNNKNCELHKNSCSCNSVHYNRAICGFSLFHEITI